MYVRGSNPRYGNRRTDAFQVGTAAHPAKDKNDPTLLTGDKMLVIRYGCSS